MKKNLIMLLTISCLFLCAAAECLGASVILQWDANTESDLAGYKVYYMAEPMSSLLEGTGASEGPSPIDVHNITTATISGLDSTKTYYFAVTAYNTSGLESSFSNIVTVEASWSVTVTSGPGGTTTNTGTNLVNAGSPFSISFMPDPGYFVSNLKINGLSVAVSGNTYTIPNTDSNKTVGVTFTPTVYPVHTTVTGVGGTVTPKESNPISDGGSVYSLVSHNGSLEFTINTQPGYLAAVTLDNSPITISGNKFLLAMITGAHELNVRFADLSLISKIGVFRNGTWYLDINGNGVWDGTPTDAIKTFGIAGDIPVTGYWDGTSISKIGVFRNGTWYLDMNGNGVWDGPVTDRLFAQFGIAGDIPVTGYWDGTSISKIGVFRNGTWYLDMNGNGVWDDIMDKTIPSPNFGNTGDKPIPGR